MIAIRATPPRMEGTRMATKLVAPDCSLEGWEEEVDACSLVVVTVDVGWLLVLAR